MVGIKNVAKKPRENAINARELRKAYQMKDRHYLRLLASRGLLVLVVLGLGACSKLGGNFVAADVDYWTCGMLPSVHSTTPGKCPICGMGLVPIVRQKTDVSGSPNAGQQPDSEATARQSPGRKELSGEDDVLQSDLREFIVPVQRQQQIGVTYAEVRSRHIRVDIRSVGTLEADQAQIFECVSRADAYIGHLHVTSQVERVVVAQPLVTIYSPDLRSPEQELVNLLKVQTNGSVASGSVEQ